MTAFWNRTHPTWLLASCATAVCLQIAAAQTTITPPKNKYTPEEDVTLGREAAAEIRKQYPVITDAALAGYLDRLGKRLVTAAPAELNNPVFEYSFTPVNLKEINAFALPGGPMFVNRGMFEAASGEGEVVGVMAHELSHVLLRHGTANATKAQNFQLGQLAGAIAGAVVGGGLGADHLRGQPDRPRHGVPQDTAASTRSRPTCSARRSWRGRGTTRGISAACSRPSRRNRVAAGRSG